MTLDTIKIPELQRLIVRAIAQAGGSFEGTNKLCESIPADPNAVLRSLHKSSKYQLIRRQIYGGGRGHKSIWMLTRKAKRYVKP